MKKWLVFLIGTALSTTVMASILDEMLVESGAVDNNFVYIDLDAAQEVLYFHQSIFESVREEDMAASNGEDVMLTLTPYATSITLINPNDLSHAKKTLIQEYSHRPSSISILCDNFFYLDKYIAANDVTVTYAIKNINHQTITSVDLNNKTCPASSTSNL